METAAFRGGRGLVPPAPFSYPALASRIVRRMRTVPRDPEDDYAEPIVARRHALAVEAAGRELPHLAGRPVPPASARGKVENLIGYAQVPVGLAGPLRLRGAEGESEVLVPLATTEGALVASHARGMKVLSEAGGVDARVVAEGLSQHPMLLYDSSLEALAAAETAAGMVDELLAVPQRLSSHGRLTEVRPEPVGRRLVLRLVFHTQDAVGINMAAQATDEIAARVAERTGARHRYVHGEDVEKRANARALVEGRGRSAVAEARVPAELLQRRLRVTAADLVAIHRSYSVGFARLATQNQLVQSANGLAALFLATGQDVAYVTESATGLLDLEETDDGSLFASAYLPSLLLGTVGGGTGQGTAAECLDLLGVRGDGGANRLAEIAAATVLAGDLSLLASFCTHEFVAAHERLGRNRPT